MLLEWTKTRYLTSPCIDSNNLTARSCKNKKTEHFNCAFASSQREDLTYLVA
eukprot:m.43557 g.43557  ORF g.43557 m.43557 type:complete len:52 (-) comp12047_c0_seq1:590-745(-)